MNGIACAIGSLPHTDPTQAVDFLLHGFSGIPLWPQLPMRTYRENMYVQYSENFPTRVLDVDKAHIHFDRSAGLEHLAEFYEHFLADDHDWFAISPDYAAGLYEFVRQLGGRRLPVIKGHVTGGVSFSLWVSDQDGRLLAYDENYFDLAVKGCLAKALWQVEFLRPHADELILFIDEPGIAGFGSAFVQVTRDQITQSLSLAVKRLHEAGVQVGIHCCANTDWSMITESGTDIVSFDAFSYFDQFILYPEALKAFYARGGRLAFGIVPTDEQVFSLTAEGLLEKLVGQVDALSGLGIDRERVISQSLISPACGLGTRTVALSQRALELTSETSAAFQRHFGLE